MADPDAPIILSSDSADDTDVRVPRPPSGSAPYERLDYEIRVEAFRREREDKDLRKRHHDLASAMAVIREEFIGLRTTVIGEDGDDGRIGTMQATIESLKNQIGSIATSAEKTAEATGSWWKWTIGQFVGVALLVIVGWIAFRVTEEHRITVLEARGERTNEKLDDVGRQLDRIEGRIDRAAVVVPVPVGNPAGGP